MVSKKKSTQDKTAGYEIKIGEETKLDEETKIGDEEIKISEEKKVGEERKVGEEKHRLEIGGDLTIYVAAELKEKLGAILHGTSAIEIDLSQVGEIDSAGLQLLLLAQRECARQQKSIAFRNPTTAVLDCWRLCNVSALFGAEFAAVQ